MWACARGIVGTMDGVAVVVAQVGEYLEEKGGGELEGENGRGEASVLDGDCGAGQDESERERESAEPEGFNPSFDGWHVARFVAKRWKRRSRDCMVDTASVLLWWGGPSSRWSQG